jgi:hypothetical protein
MTQDDWQEMLEGLRDAELLHYAKEYIKLSMAEADNPQSDAHGIVDLLFAELSRRGKEWLYDAARESVYKATVDASPRVRHSAAAGLPTEEVAVPLDVVTG